MAIQIRRGTDSGWESNNSNIVAGEPAVATDTERFFVGVDSGEYMELSNINLIAPQYDSSATYNVGDYVIYQGRLYVCNTANTTGAWNASKWNSISLKQALDDLATRSVPTSVREAIYTLLNNAAYATTGLTDEIAVVQSWAGAVTSLTLSASSLSLSGSTPQTLIPTVVPSSASVSWSSSDNSIATVVYGVVTGVSNGSCVITASAGNLSATCSVTVSGFATLESISAVYTQSGTVYESTPLDDLKDDLVVTATYSDTSTATVPSDSYSLSGTLEVGTSTITVTYQGKTTTFNVTVTASYVTDGLIAYWDGIDNTGSGHDSSASAWTDLVNGYALTRRETTYTTWGDDCAIFAGDTAQGMYTDSELWTLSNNATIEVVLKPSATGTQMATTFDISSSALDSHPHYDARRFSLFSDNTIGFIGNNVKSYTNPLASVTDIRKLSATYTGFTVNNAYANNTALSLSNNTHSFKFTGTKQYRIGVETMIGTTNYPFNGKIYAIRVYNRILTTEELTQNMNYDNARFNLGL